MDSSAPASSPASSDDKWMARAAALADAARAAGNIPVGAVVVLDGVVIAEAAEAVPNGPRPFAHAEFSAVEAAVIAGHRSLGSATLYSTAEPCILCGFAIREAGIGRVVMGREAGQIGSVRSRFPVLTADWVDRWGAPPEILWYAHSG